MNHDDPKFTAFALDELDPAEHAALEQMLRDDPDALAEVNATRDFAERLRAELGGEPAKALTPEQRTEILQRAEGRTAVAEPLQNAAARRWSRGVLALAALLAVSATLAVLLSLQQRGAKVAPQEIAMLQQTTPAPLDAQPAPDAPGLTAASPEIAAPEEPAEGMKLIAGAADRVGDDFDFAGEKHSKLAVDGVGRTELAFDAKNLLAKSRTGAEPELTAELAKELSPQAPAQNIELAMAPPAVPAEKKKLEVSLDAKPPESTDLFGAEGLSAAQRPAIALDEDNMPEAEAGVKRGLAELGDRRVKSALGIMPVERGRSEAEGRVAGVSVADDGAKQALAPSPARRDVVRQYSVAREPGASGSAAGPAAATTRPAIPAAGAAAAAPVAGPPAPAAAAPMPGKPASMSVTSGRAGLTSEAEVEQRGTVTTLARNRESAADAWYYKEGKLAEHEIDTIEEKLERVRLPRESMAEASVSVNTEDYEVIQDNPFTRVGTAPLSTFSIDVDTASYSNVRRFLNSNRLPPRDAVRIEELVNYFSYNYPAPDGIGRDVRTPDGEAPAPAAQDAPFAAHMEVAAAPWAPAHRLVRIGLKGRDIPRDSRPSSNLVFLIDVSGSMQPENKLPLVKGSIQLLVDQLAARDQVGIVVYAGASGVVLESTSDKGRVRDALSRLEAGGSTNGASGIQLAYQLAEKSFLKGGVNRVILATDGDFNVGITNQRELVDLIERKAKSGVFLSVLGFGMDNLKDSTLEKLADKGNGNYAYIDTLAEGRRVLVEQMNATLVTIAKDVKIQVEFNPAQVGAYRLIGYENRVMAAKDFNDDTKDAGEIGAGHTVTALYEIVPAGQLVPSVPARTDPLKYQPSPRSTQPVPGPGEPRRGDFSGHYYLLEEGKAQTPASDPVPSTSVATPATPTTTPETPTTTPAPEGNASKELLTLKLRYKAPDSDTSTLREFPLTDSGTTWEKSQPDFRFAASVAAFGMLLRESPHRGTASWNSVLELAMEGKGEDRDGYRAEFIGLVEKARALAR